MAILSFGQKNNFKKITTDIDKHRCAVLLNDNYNPNQNCWNIALFPPVNVGNKKFKKIKREIECLTIKELFNIINWVDIINWPL